MGQRGSLYVVGALSMLAATSVAACSEDEPVGEGQAGSGGETVGGDGPAPHAGSKNGGTGGGGSGAVGGDSIGGGGSDTGVPPDLGGYRVLETFGDIDADIIVGWSDQKRVAIADLSRQRITLVDIDATEKGITVAESFAPEDLLAGAKLVSNLAKYGDDFVALVANGAQPVQVSVVQVHDAKPELLLELPEDESVGSIVAEPGVGIAVGTAHGLLFAKSGAMTWKTLTDDNRYRPLAFEGNKLLVGVREVGRLENDGTAGAGGQGGAGGESGLDESAHVQWLDLDGKQLSDFVAYGDPHVAVKDAAGWLIGETNSFWGSYRAGIELLTETDLALLTQVPVQSAGDGTDGAYDLTHVGDRLLVANCESGLLTSPFSTTKLTLEPIRGPWAQGAGQCTPRSVETVDDTIVVGGSPLLFLLKQ